MLYCPGAENVVAKADALPEPGLGLGIPPVPKAVQASGVAVQGPSLDAMVPPAVVV